MNVNEPKLYFRYNKDTGKFLNTGMITEEMAQEWIYWTDVSIPDGVDKNYAYWNGEKWIENSEQKLQDLKDKTIYDLWSNYKTYQRKYVDPEDLTMANTLALAKKPKGLAVRNWVFLLWDAYYVVRAQIVNAASVDAVNAIDISVKSGIPPYTIKELNEEAKEMNS